MQETYCEFVMKHSWTLFCTVKKFETVVGTPIMYFLDGDTFYHTYSMLCTWSAVAYIL